MTALSKRHNNSTVRIRECTCLCIDDAILLNPVIYSLKSERERERERERLFTDRLNLPKKTFS